MLKNLEIVALKGIQARDREIQERWIGPLQQDLTAILTEITERVRETIPNFEFGKTHKLDFATYTIVPITDQSERVIPLTDQSNDGRTPRLQTTANAP